MSARLLDALLRTDLAAFIEKAYLTTAPSQPYVRNWHIELIADALTKCQNGEIRRLIINLPPRSLKSLCASVAFPAWVLGKRPETRIICASYSDELAGKHARDCRSVIESDWYKKAFMRTRINPSKRSEREFETTATGYRLSTSLGGTLTGRGGSLIIIDDPLKPQDALSEARRGKMLTSGTTTRCSAAWITKKQAASSLSCKECTLMILWRMSRRMSNGQSSTLLLWLRKKNVSNSRAEGL
jgi:hypothetical protein